MWIEQVEFIGFGNIQNEKIDFSDSKLNLVVESNEYGKTTMAEAIWSVLFDFPDSAPSSAAQAQENDSRSMSARDVRRPRVPGISYAARLQVNINDTTLIIQRDFANRTVEVFDLTHGIDITPEFIGQDGEDEVGFKLTGMTRQMFCSTCFVGQRELDEHAFGGVADNVSLSTLFQGIADSANPASTSTQAVAALNDALSRFPLLGRQLKIDQVLREIEDQKQERQTKLNELFSTRAESEHDLNNLYEIEANLEASGQANFVAEYFEMAMKVQDLDVRINRMHDRLARSVQLKEEIEQINLRQNFPFHLQRPLDELWTRRKSRQEDHARLAQELSPKESEFQTFAKGLKDRWKGLEGFTQDDSHLLSKLATTFSNVQTELDTLITRRLTEGGSESGSGEWKSVNTLETKDIEDARSFSSLLEAFKDQITDAEKSIEQANAQRLEIEHARKGKQGENRITVAVLILIAIACAAGAFFLSSLKLSAVFVGLCGAGAAISVIAAGVFFFLSMKPDYYQRDKMESIKDELGKHTGIISERRNKIGALEVKLDNIARKIGVSETSDLVRQLNTLASIATKSRDLDLLNQLISEKEKNIAKLKKEIEPFFQRANRLNLEINATNSQELFESVAKCLEETMSLNSSFQSIKNARKQLDFLTAEIEEADKHIKEILIDSNVESVDVEAGYEEFRKCSQEFQKLSILQDEYERLDADQDFTTQELPNAITRFEQDRQYLYERMEVLIDQHPELAEMTPESRPVLPWGENTDIEELRERRDQLLVKIRTTYSYLDEHCQPLMEEIAELERKYSNAKRAQLAIELARDTMQKLAGETYVSWSKQLNEIAAEMLNRTGMDFEDFRFDENLNLIAVRHGEEIEPSRIRSQLSTGTKEQLHWLARMVVSRYLSKDNPLPIILDEPFSESDDSRFLAIMQFLLDVLAAQNQIIMFSCHQQRHSWLQTQLNQSQKENLQLCHRGAVNHAVEESSPAY